jgi:hypothetical protein
MAYQKRLSKIDRQLILIVAFFIFAAPFNQARAYDEIEQFTSYSWLPAYTFQSPNMPYYEPLMPGVSGDHDRLAALTLQIQTFYQTLALIRQNESMAYYRYPLSRYNPDYRLKKYTEPLSKENPDTLFDRYNLPGKEQPGSPDEEPAR